MQLSPHFSLEELTATHSGLPNIPNASQCAHLRVLAVQLEKVRALAGCPIIIDSGFRSPEVNQKVGGVLGSAHLAGWAADIRTQNHSPYELAVLIITSQIEFDQLIKEPTWVHFACGPVLNRRSILSATIDGSHKHYRIGL